MKPLTWIAAALLALSPMVAQAQVAAPIMNPLDFVPRRQRMDPDSVPYLNPAVMQWGAPSRIGASYAESTVKKPGGPENDFVGSGVGARGVWDAFSLAAETITSEDRVSNYSYRESTNAGALAFQVGSSVALGGGVYSWESTEKSTQETKNTRDGNVLGLSLRLGDVFFIGAAAGSEKTKKKVKNSPANDQSGDGSSQSYGVAFRGGTDLRAHVEAYHEDRKTTVDPGSQTAKYKTDGGTLEVAYKALLIGANVETTKITPYDYEINFQQITLAWAPLDGGLSIVIQNGKEETKDNFGVKQDEVDTNTAGVIWLF